MHSPLVSAPSRSTNLSAPASASSLPWFAIPTRPRAAAVTCPPPTPQNRNVPSFRCPIKCRGQFAQQGTAKSRAAQNPSTLFFDAPFLIPPISSHHSVRLCSRSRPRHQRVTRRALCQGVMYHACHVMRAISHQPRPWLLTYAGVAPRRHPQPHSRGNVPCRAVSAPPPAASRRAVSTQHYQRLPNAMHSGVALRLVARPWHQAS